jgi:hypothetical protein
MWRLSGHHPNSLAARVGARDKSGKGMITCRYMYIHGTLKRHNRTTGHHGSIRMDNQDLIELFMLSRKVRWLKFKKKASKNLKLSSDFY